MGKFVTGSIGNGRPFEGSRRAPVIGSFGKPVIGSIAGNVAGGCPGSDGGPSQAGGADVVCVPQVHEGCE